jgi:peroxiredoxin
MKKITGTLLLLAVLSIPGACGQTTWLAELHRPDGIRIPFHFTARSLKDPAGWVIRNAAEKIRLNGFERSGDSVVGPMPVFESRFVFQIKGNSLAGRWEKGGAYRTVSMPFTAAAGKSRFQPGKAPAYAISGRWQVLFFKNQRTDTAVAEFKQRGSHITGTFLTPTGDYRYLEGVVQGDSLYLSAFDGSHAFLFTARISAKNSITGGQFYSGATGQQAWTAEKNAGAHVPTASSAMYVKPGEEKLRFRFRDLDGGYVSMEDERFRNKVVIVQLMGSWCPNCMDETAFLSDYYDQNRQRGVEVVSLAYEYSTNWERSRRSLQKFRDRFNVQYPILNTEVTVTDSLRTEKTLPGLSPIRMFPSTIITDKKGLIRKIDTGFNGPGTGEHYLQYKRELEGLVNKLLAE